MGDYPQVFETMIYDWDYAPMAQVISIPRREFYYGLPSIERVAEILELRLKEPVEWTQLETVLAELTGGDGNKLYRDVRIPSEESPLAARTIENLVRRSADAGGVAIGYLAIGEPTMWLLLSVPAGIILVHAARGIGAGLEEGLRKRIGRLLECKR